MPRPQNKQELINASNDNFIKLFQLIDKLTLEEQMTNFKFEDRDKNIRDVLAHLYEWHQMFDHWYRVGVIEKQIPIVPKAGYTWRTLPSLNQEIWQMYQKTSLESIKALLTASHEKWMLVLKSHSETELFTKGFYAWTKSNNLAAYFIGNMSSHYDWAIKKIKKHVKSFTNKK